ncbi:MAG: PhnD/SsuA/transferrin family substrate-binding protein [Gemmatimonadota bacterium]|nr:PhnD/SsuA/transferrin family substrate-binding protein [Gemmatimonadota bacterium]MDH3423795.1 PhnD/SsuA/transferrin family substrate-binding protein [Gemmatimonadota bacterium]
MRHSAPALRLTSLQAPNADPFCSRLAWYLGNALGRPVHFVDDEPWQVRERLFDDGAVDVAWMCGLPYARRRDRQPPTVELLVAPVMAQARYEGCPVYFTDVVVRADSSVNALPDLRGTRWAYNEPSSHSGYWLPRYELGRAGHVSGFFGTVVEAGSHEAALGLLLRGEIDGTALDSTVLEALGDERPELMQEVRIIVTWGPSPIPPWVVATHVDDATRQLLRNALTSMHLDPVGREVLGDVETTRFAEVEDADYDSIRRMAREAEGVKL